MKRFYLLKMSPKTVMELTEKIAERYIKASKKNKSIILDEYCANTGFNRKYAISKIREAALKPPKDKKKRGRKKLYSNEADVALIEIWNSFDRICAERLHPFIPEAIDILSRFSYLNISKETDLELTSMSLSTVKRRIKTHRRLNDRIIVSATKPGYMLKRDIPIQTKCWDINKPGFCEIDLVAHCGGSLQGDFINTLQFVDIKTTWTERAAVMGKAQGRVFEKIKHLRGNLPFSLLGLDSDNGSEFINHQLYRYCIKEGIVFTRSRPYMKKDNAHIEQKNYTTVRKILGYERFDKEEQLRLINDLYDNELRLFINFFQPTLKLKEKIRNGSKYKRKYGKAKTPYQRVMESPEVPFKTKKELKALYKSLDPVKLKKMIDKKIKKIINLSQKISE
jgi:hypothetical protein